MVTSKVFKASFLLTGFLMFSHHAMAEVDYTKCINFINPKSAMSGIGLGIGLGIYGNKYVPYSLQIDGKIRPHRDVVSYNHDQSKNQEIIIYETPSYSGGISLKGGGSKGFNSENPYKQQMRRAKVIIQRDSQGNIVEIVNDQNPSQAEIDKQVKTQRQFYEEGTSESVRAANDSWAKKILGHEKFQPPFYRLSHSTIKFEIKNGQCVPLESKNTALTEPKKDGKKTETTNFNINLCKDIDDFLKKNPEAASCFKKDLNDKITSVFDKYLDNENRSYPYLGYSGAGNFFGGPGAYGISSLEDKFDTLGVAKFSSNNSGKLKAIGSSPVITGHVILQNCYSQGLGSFIDDPSIWEKTGVNQETELEEEPGFWKKLFDKGNESSH